MGRKNHRQRTFTQSRYAARAGICQQHEYKEHTIVTHDWKVGRKNHRQRTFTQSRYAARVGICQQQEYKEHKIVTQDWKWAERTTGRGRSPRAGTLPAPASANSTNTKNIRLSHRTGNGQKEPPAEDVHPEQVRCPRRHLPTARIQRT